jgi:hypothetical protein
MWKYKFLEERENGGRMGEEKRDKQEEREEKQSSGEQKGQEN